MTDFTKVWESLAQKNGSKIVLLVLDGVGGIQDPKMGVTELQAANKPHLDELAQQSSCGLLEIVGPGITPGSGPGHLALFGYDPIQYQIGRGVFSALGIGFELQEGDVAARFNFCTLDTQGRIVDRRAGRIETERNAQLCARIQAGLHLNDVECYIKTESEHRGLIVLRGSELGGGIEDTDPGSNGESPLDPVPRDSASEKTVVYFKTILGHVRNVLQEEVKANMILLRGIEKYHPIRSLNERFCLKGLCIAEYPMYKGVSRLLGMEIEPSTGGIAGAVKHLRAKWQEDYDFFFLHVKSTDKAGEDLDFAKKVKAIEEVDRYIPDILKMNPDVLIVTGDHSTPAVMGAHSWHPVPVLIRAHTARLDNVDRFDEVACIHGSLGVRPAMDLMGLALAHAGRLKKFGA